MSAFYEANNEIYMMHDVQYVTLLIISFIDYIRTQSFVMKEGHDCADRQPKYRSINSYG